MPSKKPRITVYLSPDEHAQISEFAARAAISLSKFAKLVCTGIHEALKTLLVVAYLHFIQGKP